MSNSEIRGSFVWHELLTPDTGAAVEFYTRLMPWKSEPSGMPDYTLWMSGKTRAGGLMSLPAAQGDATPPHWMIYIGSGDVDASVAAAEQLGGRVCKPAADIPNVGRFAVLADPQGATFAVFRPSSPAGDDGMPQSGGTGDFTWHELATTDLDAALGFYGELFGWTRGATHDMGAMGIYQIISHAGQDVGGLYQVRDNATAPGWLSYVRIADIDKAAAAVKSAGGRILNGPHEVPGGSWIVNLLDPQGGAIAVVEQPEAAPQPKPAAKASGAAATLPAASGAATAGTSAATARKPRTGVSAGSPDAKTAAPRATGTGTTGAKTTARKPAVRKAVRKAAGRKVARGKAAGTKAAAARKSAGKLARGKRAAGKSARGKSAARKPVAVKKRGRLAAAAGRQGRKTATARGSAARSKPRRKR
jgi:uncharacterized protein